MLSRLLPIIVRIFVNGNTLYLLNVLGLETLSNAIFIFNLLRHSTNHIIKDCQD